MKYLRSLLFLLTLLLALPFGAAAADRASGTWGDLYWEYSQGELTVSGNGPIEDFYSLKDTPWTHLSEKVHTLQLEEGITAVGDCSFTNFSNLTTLRLPDSLTRIGVAAFSGCRNLTWIFNSNLVQAIPDNVRTIDIAAFANCASLTNLVLGDSVQYIGPSAFSDCYALAQITFPAGLSVIDNFAFYRCNQLGSVVFPHSLSHIGQWAFYECTALRQIRFTGSAPAIYEDAFSGVTAEVSYPSDSWRLEQRNHYGGQLTWVSVTAGAVAAGNCGDAVFWELDHKGNLRIYGNGAMYNYDTIDYPPWYDLNNLITSVTVEEGVTTIGETAFYKCTEIQRIFLSNSISSFGRDAFFDCDSLTDFTIGPNVSFIGEAAFLSCDNLQNITVPKTNPHFTSDDQGCLYTKDMTTLVCVPCGLSGHLEIPYGVIEIGPMAVYDCISITSVTIPSSVQTIGNSSFLFCRALESVVIPASVTYIDHSAFWCCMSLANIRFCGDAPVFVGDSIFVWVNAVATYPAGNPTWTEDKFIHPDSSITWVAETAPFLVDGTTFYTLQEAMEAYDPLTQYIRLTADASVSAVLEKNLRLDLNGHNLDGQIIPNGFTIYGFDSTSDQYTCDEIGYFSCTDGAGDPIVPRWQFRIQDGSTVKRYLTIESPEGYSFHRFYLGITHISLKPAATAFGYRAAFYGDKMVQSQITSLGYHLSVQGGKSLTCTQTNYKSQLTLRLKDFDVVHYGETPIYASVFMTLKGGYKIETAHTSTTMRAMLETINDSYHKYTAPQLCAIQDMIQRFPIIKKWDTENLWAEA